MDSHFVHRSLWPVLEEPVTFCYPLSLLPMEEYAVPMATDCLAVSGLPPKPRPDKARDVICE